MSSIHNAAINNLHLLVAATFTAEPLMIHLQRRCDDDGYPISIQMAPYNQIIQTCLDVTKYKDITHLLVLWRIEDFLSEELNAFLHQPSSTIHEDDFSTKMQLLSQAIECACKQAIKVIFCLPPTPVCVWAKKEQINIFYDVVRKCCKKYFENKDEYTIIDTALAQTDEGIMRSFDLRNWYLYKQPWSNALWLNFSKIVFDQFYLERRRPIKCAVLDCDGTLWGGIVGEDGIGGIQLSDYYPGCVFKDIQRFLLTLKSRGILLAILSKNNESDVLEVFKEHSDMVLKWEDISAAEIGWEEKYIKIQAIAKKLNIGLDSLLFIDDSPIELEKMRYYCPEIACIQVPENLLDYPMLLQGLPYFNTSVVTNEDVLRTQMLLNEEKRQALRTALSIEDFLSKINLELHIDSLSEKNVARAHQLLERTNQFNMTMSRFSQSQLRNLLSEENRKGFVLSARDSFGEYGLTGLAILQFNAEIAIIENFLLSCRVLNRRVEFAFMNFIFNFLARKGINHCKIPFLPTGKNKPAEDFLNMIDFNRHREDGHIIEVRENLLTVDGIKLTGSAIDGLNA